MSSSPSSSSSNEEFSSFRKVLISIASYNVEIGYSICGGVSGTVSRTVAAPFERLKILFQVQDLSVQKPTGKDVKYNGIIRSLIKIGKEEGISGYFKGNGSNVVRIVPYTAVQFVSYEKYKEWMMNMNPDGRLTTWQRLNCGGLAGMTSVIVSYPLDVVRCRLSAQYEPKIYHGINHALKLIYQTEGIKGLYRGIVPTLLGIAPYVALNFTTYEHLKVKSLEYLGSDNLGVVTKLVLGAVSGTFAQTVTYPFDVVRRRMQMVGMSGAEELPKTMPSAFRQVYQKYGFTGFYKGLLSNYMKVIPVVSINFVVYEYMKIFLGLAKSGSGEV
ncbi:predicted protein [Naegleria gruberi]|uniref:Predicted protein n=1 Tax=Naegleria gruberi TaxID=5762 RepID=D2VM08_NAEGR|nr:uncharacterized protein NAEGRDRAFT_69969 [Naegleria gruberi]EFC42146.1 predicted protein [Naegleria gruberi]|eukprot:XP_002674890.1 predicted protein [Naegleria gruberi strain NEG-M]